MLISSQCGVGMQSGLLKLVLYSPTLLGPAVVRSGGQQPGHRWQHFLPSPFSQRAAGLGNA